MSRQTVLSTRIATEQDVFAVRRQARQFAAAMGLEGQDQVRVAAAVSEVTRQMLGALGSVSVDLLLEQREDSPAAQKGTRPSPAATLLWVQARSPGTAEDSLVEAVRVTRGLMDEWDVVRDGAGMSVLLGRRVPDRTALPTQEAITAIRAELLQLRPGTPLQELAEHNRQLLAALEDVQRQRDELLRLNEELAETNNGVVALYTELSEELEATNRGVVALYAELDQRTTQLREASEAKSRFLANISHELRAPVTAIVGLTRLLRDPHSDPLSTDQAQQLGLIDTSANSLLTLINELLDLAKAESGRLVPQREEVDLPQLFGTLRGTLRAVPRSPETELSIVDPDVGPVRTDPMMLSQVLRNLLTNAIKFTPSGSVRLTGRLEDGGDLSLTVEDTGIGIPEEEHERVFEEFHQVRNKLQANSPGTGLGLPYARRLVHLLGGSIALSSEPGRGSTFTVRLPVDVAGETGPRTPRVVIIDDDGGFRTAAAGVLRSGGYTVVEAPDAGTGLAAAEAHPPDLILLDLRLAEQHGAAVLDVLAANSRLADVPVVVVSGYPEDLDGHPTAGRATAVLDKSRSTLDDLCEVVRSTVPPGDAR
jgi:signal transduction histidine kinase